MNRMPSAYSADSVSLTSRMCSRARGAARRDDLGQGLPHDHDRVVGHDQGELAFGAGRVEIRAGRE
jgi:hypothetical protein